MYENLCVTNLLSWRSQICVYHDKTIDITYSFLHNAPSSLGYTKSSGRMKNGKLEMIRKEDVVAYLRYSHKISRVQREIRTRYILNISFQNYQSLREPSVQWGVLNYDAANMIVEAGRPTCRLVQRLRRPHAGSHNGNHVKSKW